MAFLLLLLSVQSLEEVERDRHAKLEAARRAGAEPALLEAEWEYGHALLRLAEMRKTPELWKRVVAFWTEITWTRDDTLMALEARVINGRAHQALQDWGACFANLKAARVPGRAPELAEIATRALIVEARARMELGRDHEISLRAAREHLARHPAEADRELFLRLRLETARMLRAAHHDPEARRVLEEIHAGHPKTDAGDAALGLLADLFRRRVDEHAERLFETHAFTEAAVRFRGLPPTPHARLRLGRCYVQMRRFHEAALALRLACETDSPHRLDAALLLEKVLARLDDPGLPAHRAWLLSTFGEKAGAEAVLRQADALLRGKNYKEAADAYGRLPDHPEAVHSRAYCFFRMNENEKALELFRAYLASEPRTPRSTDTAIDLAAWCLARLDRGAELLEHVERHVPADPLRAQWRLAHRVDALARLGRFDEARGTLGKMTEELGLDPLVRALERLAAGYEAVVREKNDPKLWSAYARTVLALSEKSFKPLRGEKLIAAADAIYLDSTSDAYGVAYDLYSQYLAGAKLRPEDERPIEYRRAVAAAGSGRLPRARQIADALTVAEPFNGTYAELRADVLSLQAEALARSPERRELIAEAAKVYGELSAAGRDRQGEAWFRLTWKYVSRLAEADPDGARRFFRIMEARGYGAWDEARWGYRARMEAVKARLKP